MRARRYHGGRGRPATGSASCHAGEGRSCHAGSSSVTEIEATLATRSPWDAARRGDREGAHREPEDQGQLAAGAVEVGRLGGDRPVTRAVLGERGGRGVRRAGGRAGRSGCRRSGAGAAAASRSVVLVRGGGPSRHDIHCSRRIFFGRAGTREISPGGGRRCAGRPGIAPEGIHGRKARLDLGRACCPGFAPRPQEGPRAQEFTMVNKLMDLGPCTQVQGAERAPPQFTTMTYQIHITNTHLRITEAEGRR